MRIAVFTLLPLFIGCAISPGRVAVLDLDLRSPEQIEASEYESRMIYRDAQTNGVDVAEELDADGSVTGVQPGPEFLARLLSLVDGRLRILSLEWRINKED